MRVWRLGPWCPSSLTQTRRIPPASKCLEASGQFPLETSPALSGLLLGGRPHGSWLPRTPADRARPAPVERAPRLPRRPGDRGGEPRGPARLSAPLELLSRRALGSPKSRGTSEYPTTLTEPRLGCSPPGRRQERRKASGGTLRDRSCQPARSRGLVRNRTVGRPPAGVRTASERSHPHSSRQASAPCTTRGSVRPVRAARDSDPCQHKLLQDYGRGT
jgi:hypothetical protein